MTQLHAQSPIRLAGRTAVVTGAGAGLGRIYAHQLAARGASVVVNDISQVDGVWRADEVVEEIEQVGGRAVADHHNAATVDGTETLIATAVDVFGSVDIVVANAGISRRGGFEELTVPDITSVIEVNLMGPIWLCRAAFPHMRERGWGRIVLAASAAGVYGHGVGVNYCVSKAGVVGLLRALSIEGEPHGIRVNAVSPFALTPMTESSPGLTPEIAALLDPEQVAPVVVYLGSEACQVTGEVFATAGGTVARTFSSTSKGARLEPGTELTPERVRDTLDQILDRDGAVWPRSVRDERQHLLGLPND